ncbi:MAG: Crp/Fnr family transcriptional regulator [Saprospiraceae bacterium]
MQNTKVLELIRSIYPTLNDDTLEQLSACTKLVKLPKGTKLFTEGKRHHHFYFIVQGLAKAYYLKDGKEICSWFAAENETIGNMSTHQGKPSNETIELLEDSALISFHIHSINELAKDNLAVSHFIIEILYKEIIYLEKRIYDLQFVSSHERYKRLLKEAPDILQRISLTDIASYLGVSRETLSRIRGQRFL